MKSSTRENVRANIEEKFRYTQKEIQNILRINCAMMTAEDVEKMEEEINRSEQINEERQRQNGI